LCVGLDPFDHAPSITTLIVGILFIQNVRKTKKGSFRIFIFFAESNSKQESVNDYLATYRAARQSTRRKFQSFQLTPWGKTTKTSITVQFEIAFSLQDCNFTKYKLLFKSPSET
jgi:hypothetical protein